CLTLTAASTTLVWVYTPLNLLNTPSVLLSLPPTPPCSCVYSLSFLHLLLSPPPSPSTSCLTKPGYDHWSSRDFLDCPYLDETLELGSLHHDSLSDDGLHREKAAKDAFSGFTFNSAAGGQSMLSSYVVGVADLDPKLRSTWTPN
ncbi:chromodomain-helicase-DNA-binding protein 6%2C partial, partial [Xyrichtys novacula]